MSETKFSTNYLCICDQPYNQKSQLRKHVNVCKYVQNQGNRCSVNPTKKDLLQLAIANCDILSVNNDDESPIEENDRLNDRFRCGCHKHFKSKGGYYRHIKKCKLRPEQQVVTGKTKCNEPGCLLTFKYIRDLRQHLNETHKIQFTVEDKTFNRYSDFIRWKEIYEAETCSCFYHRKTEIRSGRRVEYWYCNRSGIYRSASQGRRRKLKSQGILKINNNCTSSITLTINETEGTVQAIIYHTHYGHEAELIHLRIPKSDKQEIASKLLQGVQIDDILSLYKKDNSSNELTERKHLIKRRDILNISKKYNVNIILPQTRQSSKKIKKKKDNAREATISCVYKDSSLNILESKKRHNVASQLPLSAVNPICNNVWKIYLENNLVSSYSLNDKGAYQVTKSDTICDRSINCKPHCNCNICYHSYFCTCLDFLSKNIICEHIHLVVLFQVTPQIFQYEGCVDKSHNSNQDHITPSNFTAKPTSLAQLNGNVKVEDLPEDNNYEVNAQNLKNIKKRLEKLMSSTLQKVSECNNYKLLKCIEDQMTVMTYSLSKDQQHISK